MFAALQQYEYFIVCRKDWDLQVDQVSQEYMLLFCTVLYSLQATDA